MTPTEIQQQFDAAKTEANKALVGMDSHFEILFTALLTGGHVLLEGVPGTAKTLMAKTLSLLVDAEFTRIQFTPDLMPSDILGTSVFEMSSGKFYLKKGPLFTQICLADEINRAPSKLICFSSIASSSADCVLAG
ncbi:MAG: AAA family ATPase, partial [Chloroflexota bacterium]